VDIYHGGQEDSPDQTYARLLRLLFLLRSNQESVLSSHDCDEQSTSCFHFYLLGKKALFILSFNKDMATSSFSWASSKSSNASQTKQGAERLQARQ